MVSRQLRVYAPYVGQRFLGLERVKTDIAGKRLDMISLVSRKVIGGRVLKLEHIQVVCPACGQPVEAVASDGRVKGYCAVARQFVDFLIDAQRVPTGKHSTVEYRAKISASAKKRWQDPEYRAKQIATHKGKHPTVETKAKISAALTRRHNEKG